MAGVLVSFILTSGEAVILVGASVLISGLLGLFSLWVHNSMDMSRKEKADAEALQRQTQAEDAAKARHKELMSSVEKLFGRRQEASTIAARVVSDVDDLREVTEDLANLIHELHPTARAPRRPQQH